MARVVGHVIDTRPRRSFGLGFYMLSILCALLTSLYRIQVLAYRKY